MISLACGDDLAITVAIDNATWPPLATLYLPDGQMPFYPQIRASGSLYQNGDVSLEFYHGTNTLVMDGVTRDCVETEPGAAPAATIAAPAGPPARWQAPQGLTQGEGGLEAYASVTQDEDEALRWATGEA